jgi:putative Ca2+/H+ antiporter (TMEM165/GDT1 family)
VYACIALSSAATLVAITTIHKESMYAFPSLVAVVFGRLFTRENVPAKRVELGASLALLLNFGALTWAAAAAA